MCVSHSFENALFTYFITINITRQNNFFYNKHLDKNILIGLQRYSKGHILAIRHTLVLMVEPMLN